MQLSYQKCINKSQNKRINKLLVIMVNICVGHTE